VDDATFEIDVVPFQIQDFPQSGAGEQKKPDRRDGVGVQFPEPVLRLCGVLCRRLRQIDIVVGSDLFRSIQSFAEPSKFR
jgi:hypothetical protein